ncbi:tRNA pseudouridine(38-40) synthase TruA [Arcobacter sp. CECT 8985]|uniref:tRNA pseudouridine(38-40) synthase TruA n=1 Tax=Arcobacter sp. CECT 8985 TaxID=1935424 RepID=UPI00100A7FC5|nr:tRNA pseudouridine(38-40) synthase TruA [Arcobacter sp. CECT 8985]RXJ85582.1 tRNA pseudouridine(38-40) synthase TruA [Arcobacter sp. CECT 8985]
MNTKFVISYDGSLYQGSQTQPNGLSVEDKILEVFKVININSKIILSGRTDKDVHATGQVFNAVLPDYWTNLDKLKQILNRHLPLSIRVNKINFVSDEFHSRFHAKKRVYRYVLTTKPTAFNSKYLTAIDNIDENKIKEAIKLFIGIHDFEYFHKKGSAKENLVREIFDTSFYKYKDIYVFKFVANSYLRSQIRLMVGFLLKINDGKLTKEDLLLQLKKKKHIYKTPASPYGLYLARVYY